ncbi:consortin isoform X1 [Panthera pardus]|uniref:Consortin isoform X1 n=1 Tax=Panthera pardus TaxID=9691 RepID=A0A9W2W3D8_PANPR|nr:consortin isoform X1 [Panthera pardus]XP_053765393.1 consortin isoform X1 [Panthera pardus]XP_053765394.1 consortin isoform X1 [Panthera pardus]
MDDSETPTYNLQIEPQDGYHPGDGVGSTVTRLASASDENENQLDGDGQERLSPGAGAMGRPAVCEQDSLNNNERCTPSYEVAVRENLGDTSYESPKDGQASVGKDKKIPGKRSSRTKRGTTKKIAQVLFDLYYPVPARNVILRGLSSGDTTPLMHENVLSASTHAVSDDESAEVNANDPAEAPKPVLQYLFSLIRGEVKQVDSRALPLCLHQIAESYFQEEDYEKAMKFIQLERLYHEKLLANLSAIQEEWETKWKTVQPHTVTSVRNSEKGFNGEDFERLTKFCTTHQDPVLSKHKIAAVEKPLGRKCFTPLIVSEDPNERGTTAKEPESETCLGREPRRASPESGGCCNQMDRQADAWSFLVTAGKDHTAAEPLCRAQAALELRAQPPGAAGSRSEDARQGDSRLQPAQTVACRDAAEIEGPAADPGALLPSESMIEPSVFPGSDLTPPALSSEGRYSQTQRKELRLPLKDASEALPADRLENSELDEPQQPDLTDSDGKSPRGPAGSERSQSVLGESTGVSDLGAGRPEGGGAADERVSKETEDYLNSLLQGCLEDTEDALSCEDREEDSDLLPDLSPEEASYSLQENLPSDESCLSLDDLAKRIEIAEVVPAEGLVSILKKRNDSVGGRPAQMQQKPSKRRVRFQEIDDGLDQDEVGGGSCILLVLLCIATVFLSVGGTALYCTFGDRESPVCTDFADNMDFYYTKFLQGMAELKHWIYLS